MRRFLITMGVIVVVLAVGLFGLDRALAAYAEGKIAEQTSAEVAKQGMRSGTPTVDVGGFPFATQVVAGEYKKIQIDIPDLQGQGLRVPNLTLVATGVKAPLEALRSGQGSITAAKVTGSAKVPWDVVIAAAKLKDLTLSADEDGSLKVAGTVTFAGFSVPLTGKAKVSLAGPATLRVQVTDLQGQNGNLNSVVKNLIEAYKDRLVFTIAVPKLPYNLKLSKVSPRPDGLDLQVFAEDVPLTNGGAPA
jgi:hypothetical protein